jgi:hypothetical protein
MPSSISRPASSDQAWLLTFLWSGLMAGPFAWAALLEVNYVLSYVSCEVRSKWMLHLSTAVALIIVGLGAVAAWRAWRASAADEAGPQDTRVARARTMAVGGLAMCAWFALVILATEIPAVVLRPCTP